jgi:3'-phosphoadenosine 5'-phosphosulfate sulfotransferase (PAPS reductase)/FAD synthetase
MEDFELTLFDRLNAIRDTVNKYGIDNFYISFSGGKDSTILHYLIDMALPNNKIPRVYVNTGIEYLYIYKFVDDMRKTDNRIIILQPTKNIKDTLEEFGYPFKSKQHSHNLNTYQNSGLTKTSMRYLGLDGGKVRRYRCPKMLEYQFSKDFKIKVSQKCCDKLKKEPIKNYELNNNKHINITGMRKDEKGLRNNLSCIVTDRSNKVIKFHPLSVVSNEWCEWFIKKYNIKLCKLYYEPYNFTRTGCKGCPFALELQHELDIMEKYLPNERKQCEVIWKPIYDEYRRINYRLKDKKQQKLDI